MEYIAQDICKAETAVNVLHFNAYAQSAHAVAAFMV